MAELSYLVSTVLMGLFLVAVVAFVRFSENREHTRQREPADGPSLASRLQNSPGVWIVTFLLLAFVAGGGAVLFVSGGLPAGTAQAAGIALGAVVATSLVAYFGWGGYYIARGRGLGNAQAAAVGAWLLGMLFVAAIAVRLVTI